MEERQDRYKEISRRIDEWLPTFGDWFSSEDVWRHITGQGVMLTDLGKRDVAVKLWNEVKKGTLRKRGKRYKAVDKTTIKKVNPFEVAKDSYVKLNWPNGFGFENTIKISEGDLILIAGESNQGKSTLAQCLLAANWDNLPCFYISTETTPSKFVRRLMDIPGAEPLIDGEPKFQFATMDGDNYDEIIEPDMVNIIDWVSLRGNFYEIENIIRDSKARMNKGILVLVLQKKAGQDTPVGGNFAITRSDVVLALSTGILKVIKAKDYNSPNPNGKFYAFEIPDGVCGFQNVREVIKCTRCRNKINPMCSLCNGTGYEDVYQSDGKTTTVFANRSNYEVTN